ncbi:hypothetical protein GCK72_012063 [Caenorhabditis remanei]|uniref:SPK domain-containing protein n=1 Tax=Caenorhabditis remanei TaxID=31234 RepID=A0A6A5GLR1_CAERE|nr:hypothetical protein GCK72_012063 [Caenorhabditis remanei]KAF1755613.1 hypothetical protein GCK72_012063 [Caenorhabditis remanei]
MSKVTELPSWAGASPENLEFLNFIAEKAQFVKDPFNIRNICREFKNRARTRSSDSNLSSKLMRYRKRIHELEEFDIDTKVKILYALSAPIDRTFLKELTEQAEIVLDAHGRITEYHKKTGGLDLKGDHIFQKELPLNTQRNRALMDILMEKSKETSCFPITDASLIREFKMLTNDTNSECYLRRVYQQMKTQIYTSNELDNETKIKMLFVSSASIPKSVLEEIRKDAEVEVDEEMRITRYESNDGNLKLSGKQSLPAKMGNDKRTRRKRMGTAYLGEYGKILEQRELEMHKNVKKRRYYTVGSNIVKKRSQRIQEEMENIPNEKYKEIWRNSIEKVDNSEYFYEELYEEEAEEIQYYPDFPISIKQETQIEEFPHETPFLYNSFDSQHSQYATSSSEQSFNFPYHGGFTGSQQSDSSENQKFPFDLLSKEDVDSILLASEHPILEEKPLLFDVKPEFIDLNSIPDENFLNFINNDDQFFISSNDSEESASASGASSDSISLTEILSIFRDLTDEIGLKKLRDELSMKIVQLEPRNLNISISSILLALDSALPVITKSIAPPEMPSINLADFLRLLKNATSRMNSSQLGEFQQELDEMCNDEEKKNRNVSHETIRHGLEHALDIILPLF